MTPPLDADALRAALAELPEWELRDGRLHRTLRFPSFARAFGFMAAVALVAERMDHHPDWRNVHRTVEIELTTHAAGPALTELDVALAHRIDELAATGA
jgi:4a-hydroxytetrahydrobiopterin dehydratase